MALTLNMIHDKNNVDVVAYIEENKGIPSNDQQTNKLAMIYDLYEKNLLDKFDSQYLEDVRFKSLYKASDERLDELLLSFNVLSSGDKISKIKSILDSRLYPMSQCMTADNFIVPTINGELYGGGSMFNVGVPNYVKINVPKVLSVSTGYGYYMALTLDGTLYAWGLNDKKQLGFYSGENIVTTPTELPIKDVIKVSCGNDFTIFLTKSGVYSCGNNESGQLGLGHNYPTMDINKIDIDGVVDIACGYSFTVAQMKDGTLYQWGLDVTSSPRSSVYTPSETMIKSAIAIGCGNFSVVVMKKDGIFQYGIDVKIGKLPHDDILWFNCGYDHIIAMKTDGLYTISQYTNEMIKIHVNNALWATISNEGNMLVRTTKELYQRVKSSIGERIIYKIDIKNTIESLYYRKVDVLAEKSFALVRGKAKLTQQAPGVMQQFVLLPWDIQKDILSRNQ